MFSLVIVSCLLGGALSVPVHKPPLHYEPPKEIEGWWFDGEATPWDTEGAQLQNSPFYQTFRQMDQQLDMYGYAQHVGKINRGEYYNPELNLPGDRAFGYKGDFNAKDLASGAFRNAPQGQRVIAEPVHVELGMAGSVGEEIIVGAGQFIKPDGTILLHTRPSPNPCHYDHPCAYVFPGYRATCVALDSTTAKCERIVNGKYSAWSDFGACNGDCEKERTRTCDNPAPSNGGAHCVGPSSEIASCTGDDADTDACVDGGWGEWSLYDDTQCDSNCEVEVTRSCDNPPPSPGGSFCVADADGFDTKTDITSCIGGEGACPSPPP